MENVAVLKLVNYSIARENVTKNANIKLAIKKKSISVILKNIFVKKNVYIKNLRKIVKGFAIYNMVIKKKNIFVLYQKKFIYAMDHHAFIKEKQEIVMGIVSWKSDILGIIIVKEDINAIKNAKFQIIALNFVY